MRKNMRKNNSKKRSFSRRVKKSILIKASNENIWKKISNIVGLSEWVLDVKKTVHLSKIKRGVGAIRNISFRDGSGIEEHIVAWENKKCFSYIATSGLPLHVYYATILLEPQTSKSTRITWKSYLYSKKTTKKEFDEFVAFLTRFYQTSLKNLKTRLEK
jgi:hypothetical protein